MMVDILEEPVKMDLKLVPDSDPILRTVCEPFDFNDPQYDPEELAEALVECMTKHNGLGLSANQVGLNVRVFALASDPYYVCFNPRIVTPSEELIVLEEGCLTYPGLFVKVKRPRHIRMRFQGPDGQTYTKQFTGMTARAVLHEIDHLDGKVFYEQANRIHRDAALKKWRRRR